MKWELVDCGGGRYSIMNVKFQKFIGCSRSGHSDGEIVQSSLDRLLWTIEDGPGGQYRYDDSSYRDGDSESTWFSIRHISNDNYWNLGHEGDKTPVSHVLSNTISILSL